MSVKHAEDDAEKITRAFYNRFDWAEYQRRRTQFDQLDLTSPDVDAAREARYVMGAGNDPGFHLTQYTYDGLGADAGFVLWRARRLTDAQVAAGYEVGDLWEPPDTSAGDGRFNERGTALLYGCLQHVSELPGIAPWVALREARVYGKGTRFVAMMYTLRSDLLLARVGAIDPDSRLSHDQRRVEREITQFLVDLVRRTAPQERGPETYKFTRELLRDFYPLKHGTVKPGWDYHQVTREPDKQGWRYESVQNPYGGTWNIAIPSDHAHRSLELSGVVTGVVAEDDGTLAGLEVDLAQWTADPDFSGGKLRLVERDTEEDGSLSAFDRVVQAHVAREMGLPMDEYL